MQLTAGYLHGFDKFMNLVLMNVDETYTVMVRVPHPYTVMTHEPADPQPLQPHYAINPDTGMFISCHCCSKHRKHRSWSRLDKLSMCYLDYCYCATWCCALLQYTVLLCQ